MLKNFVKIFGGDPNKRTIEQYSGIAEQINVLEAPFEALSDSALRAKTDEFKARIAESVGNVDGLDERDQFKAQQEALNEILPEAFAAVREAAKRTIGQRHYDVQLIGGVALHRGSIAEMRTGEGKTLVATLPVYLNALLNRGIHLITVNDYLARRDARWMAPIYDMLGLTVGVLQMAAVTENGKKAFLIDFSKESPHEDQHHLRMVDRHLAYEADVTYGTNSEFGFDYLRDNMTMRLSDRVQRGHHFAIVDEVDNVLIDEARTPLIISGPASGDLEWYGRMSQVVKQLKPEDFEVNEKDRQVSLTEVGLAHVEQILNMPLMDPDRPEDVTPEQGRLRGYLEQAMRAQHLFKRNKDYLVQAGKVVIVDEFTGRVMPGRRWSDGLHQAVEAKEGAKVEPENVTYATITLQNYFRMYKKLSGMTGTALTESEEFSKIYNLEVTPIPPNLEYQAFGKGAPLVEVKAKDEDGYAYNYFAKREDPQQSPLFYRRKDYPDVIYKTVEAKLRSLITEIVREHVRGRPMLIGTTSVESSEQLSGRLKAEAVRRLLQIALVRRVWMEANNREEDGRLIPELQQFNEPLEKISPDTLRKFVQPFGIATINLEDPSNLPIVLDILRLEPNDANRLKSVLQGGVTHQVLNARKHTEESQIIAGAGAFGAVTIATNMAGRGVDIKLGGELDEWILTEFKNLLKKNGVAKPYSLSNPEILANLIAIVLKENISGYEHAVNKRLYFETIRNNLVEKHGTRPGQDEWQRLADILYTKYEVGLKVSGRIMTFWFHTEQELSVRELEGLMVIGSERHEARRIDNQLRGRAARQGDPGSSRFYLSLQDELMRIQGGSQVSSLMERLKVDDSLPLEVNLVGNIIEQSQHRIEGANFDVRKHLLEYDDVINKQRGQIYGQRDRIFQKEDLSEDINEMLEAEIKQRVSTGLEDEDGPWKLIAWLEQIQPPFMTGERLFPSFGLSLLLKELPATDDPSTGSGQALRHSTFDLISRAIKAENAHHLRAIEEQIEKIGEVLEAQVASRGDTLDAYFEGLNDMEDGARPRPQKMLEEINALVGLPLRLNNDQLRRLGEDPAEIKEDIRDLIATNLTAMYTLRTVAAVKNRTGESIGEKFDVAGWDDAANKLLEATKTALERRRDRLVGNGGQINRDIDNLIPEDVNDTTRLQLLRSLSQGSRTGFDQKTHKQVRHIFNRFNFVFLIAQLLDGMSSEQVTEDVLTHLEEAQDSLQMAWGEREYSRLSANAQHLADFGQAAKKAFGEERLNETAAGLEESDRKALVEAIGQYALNESHRQLLLGATTELWVDYLTRIEALRISIGLEAYAQRDPLVQYKGRASEMFTQLVEDIRGLVIGRLFAYQPRPLEIKPVEMSQDLEEETQDADESDSNKKKKRRRR